MCAADSPASAARETRHWPLRTASDAGIDRAAVKLAQLLIAERLARQGASADGVATDDEQVSDLTLSSDFSRDDRS